MIFPTATAVTSGRITIDLYDVWLCEWHREWADLGELHRRRETREHIDKHKPFLDGPCVCFECRVFTAWDKHLYPPTNRKRSNS